MGGSTLLLDDSLLLEELGLARRVAEKLVDDPNDADDVVQEAWLRTRAVRMRFDSRGRLRAWLIGVVRRMAHDTLRARRRRTLREQRAARMEARADAGDVVERSALLERLLQAVRALDEPQRSTMLLRYLDGYSTAEIASAMSLSEEVVRKRLSRARTHLRAALGVEPTVPMETRANETNTDGTNTDETNTDTARGPTPRKVVLRTASLAGALVAVLLGVRWLTRAPEGTSAGLDGPPAPAVTESSPHPSEVPQNSVEPARAQPTAPPTVASHEPEVPAGPLSGSTENDPTLDEGLSEGRNPDVATPDPASGRSMPTLPRHPAARTTVSDD